MIRYIVSLPTEVKTCTTEQEVIALSRANPSRVVEVSVMEERSRGWERIERAWLKNGEVTTASERA